MRQGLLFVTIVCLLAAHGFAGGEADLDEAKLKGTVQDLKLPPKGSEKEIAHLVLKNGADALDVYLCPQTFLADMGFSFSKGDEIALTGSRIKLGEADLILAREVVKGSDTLVLRDEKGSPVWGWHR